MDETVELTRPRTVPVSRVRSPLVVAAIACASTTVGFGLAVLALSPQLFDHTPHATAAAAVTPPVATPPPPAADIEVDNSPSRSDTPPRAPAPVLDGQCLVGGDQPAQCAWDNGLPAISDDGATIARLAGSATGATGTAVELIDVKTSKVTRVLTVVTADEAATVDGDEPAAQIARVRLAATIVPRLATVDAAFAAGSYRPLAYLGASGAVGTDVVISESETTHALVEGDAVRITQDRTREDDNQVVIFQRRIVADHPAAPSPACRDVSFTGMRVWFDEQTRAVLAEEVFGTGADETCTDLEVARVTAAR